MTSLSREQYEKETGESAIDSSTGHRHRTQQYAEWLEKRLDEQMTLEVGLLD